MIFINITYHSQRSYALGFLSLGIPEAPGNQGLLDQLEALKLVQASIANFETVLESGYTFDLTVVCMLSVFAIIISY